MDKRTSPFQLSKFFHAIDATSRYQLFLQLIAGVRNSDELDKSGGPRVLRLSFLFLIFVQQMLFLESARRVD